MTRQPVTTKSFSEGHRDESSLTPGLADGSRAHLVERDAATRPARALPPRARRMQVGHQHAAGRRPGAFSASQSATVTRGSDLGHQTLADEERGPVPVVSGRGQRGVGRVVGAEVGADVGARWPDRALEGRRGAVACRPASPGTVDFEPAHPAPPPKRRAAAVVAGAERGRSGRCPDRWPGRPRRHDRLTESAPPDSAAGHLADGRGDGSGARSAVRAGARRPRRRRGSTGTCAPWPEHGWPASQRARDRAVVRRLLPVRT